MRKFILVDHSLRDQGGHHFPYAMSVLQAAEDAGLAPVIATHRDFASHNPLPGRWPLYALFGDISYSPHTLDTQSARAQRKAANPSWLRGWRDFWRQRARRRHTQRFAADCIRLFEQVPLNEGDIVFLPTASELDLQGLGAFIATAPDLAAVQWHVQFHFGIHATRDWRAMPDAGARADAMRRSLQAARARLGRQSLHFWCTTESLAAQYQSLGIATFIALPYPVHPLFAARRTLRIAPHPARIACLGHARREKNQRLLPQLLRQLWTDYFFTGRAQLVVQNARAPLRRALRDSVRQLSGTQSMGNSGTAGDRRVAAVDCDAGALDQEQYVELVCGSDIGLLLYDAKRYHDRCSGVLLEMLVAGVPVIVPSGSWLSDQIDPVNQVWLADLAAALQREQRLVELPLSQSGSSPLPELACETLLVQLPHTATPKTARARRLRCTQLSATGACLADERRLLEPAALNVLWRLVAGARTISLRYDDAAAMDDSRYLPPRIYAIRGAAVPLGAVGLTIEDAGEAAGGLRDILQHIGHYKQHSALLAPRCAAASSAPRIIENLLERA